jgi:integrase
MKSKPLTDTACRNAKYNASGSGNKLADGGGLYLELMPSGTKKWRLKFRHQGKENRLTFGNYPAITLAMARERRSEAKAQLADGADPAACRDTARREAQVRSSNVFGLVANEWYETKKAGWSLSHAARVRKQLDREVGPAFGARPIAEITAPELLAAVRKIEARGALETASKTLQTCGQVFRYAIATGRAERDVAADLRGALKARPVTNLTRISEAELPELLAKIDTYPGDPLTRFALQLLTRTFVRTKELRFAEWAEFDLQKAEWRIPAAKMKSDVLHIVPLSTQVIGQLKALQGLTGSRRWLFPNSSKPEKPMSENTVLYALYRMGYHSRMTGHGFRGLASTILNENGFNRDWIERQLAHVERDSVRSAYNHAEYLAERRRMMQWYSDHLDQLMNES